MPSCHFPGGFFFQWRVRATAGSQDRTDPPLAQIQLKHKQNAIEMQSQRVRWDFERSGP